MKNKEVIQTHFELLKSKQNLFDVNKIKRELVEIEHLNFIRDVFRGETIL